MATLASGARAQDAASSEAPTEDRTPQDASATDELSTEIPLAPEAEAPLEEAVVAAPAPPRTTRRTTPPSPQAYDSELPALSLAPPPEAGFEISIAMNPSLLVAGLGGLAPSIATTTDLVIAIDPRAWFGIGLGISYVETRTMAFPNIPEMRFTTTTVSVPLLFQYYFSHPELGAAVPTLRLRAAGAWAETPNSPGPSNQMAGADLAIYGGVTWMGASWLALRILGGVNGSFRATLVGPISITANVGIEAVVAAVIRL